MTSLYLLLWIAGGILLQLAVYLGVGFVRHWQELRALRTVTAGMELAGHPQPSAVSHAAVVTAWLQSSWALTWA